MALSLDHKQLLAIPKDSYLSAWVPESRKQKVEQKTERHTPQLTLNGHIAKARQKNLGCFKLPRFAVVIIT